MKLWLTLLAVALVTIACGDGEGGDATSAAEDPETPAATETAQTPPPETTPGRAPDTSAPVGTQAAPATSGPAYDYDYGDRGGDAAGGEDEDSGDGAEAALKAADSEFGEILVGPEGMTLYIFLPDEQGESTCYDSCADTWPPLEGEVTAGTGLDETMLGTVERTDGTTQATYNGWPLYHFANDSESGDVTGQGVGDNWFVIDPAGEVVEG